MEQKKPFEILNGMQKKVETVLQTFEPEDLLDLSIQIDDLGDSSTSLLTDIDTIRTYYMTNQERFFIPNYL